MPSRVLTSPNKATSVASGTSDPKKTATKKRVSKRTTKKAGTKSAKRIASTFNASRVLNVVLTCIILFILGTLVYASTPNPGHPWTQVGDGTWASTGMTSYHTYTFPDATATVMTTLDVKQGDIIYGTAASTTAVLPKDTNATRYLSNTGTNNNPAWSLVNLTNGVSGILPSANGGTGNAFTAFTGPTALRTFTLPDANATILTDNADVTVAQGGTGVSNIPAGAVVVGNGTSPITTVSPGVNGSVLIIDNGTPTSSPITSQFGVNTRRQVLIAKNAGAATVSTYNTAAPTLTATASTGDTAEGAFLGSSTTATVNTASGIISAAFNIVRFDWAPDFQVRIKTDQGAITSTRYWIGLVSATPDGTTASPAISMVGFRYDATAQATAFWQTITCTTTCVTTGSTTNTTSVAVTPDTVYTLRANCTTSSCKFYINDTLVATHTTTLPASTQLLGYAVRVQNLAAVVRAIRTAYISIVHNN